MLPLSLLSSAVSPDPTVPSSSWTLDTLLSSAVLPVAAVIAQVVTIVVVAVVASWLVKRAAKPLAARLDETLTTLVVTAIRVVIGLSALLAVLGALGIDTTAVLTSVGVLGLTVGFAAQDTLSNVISGFFILLDRPFVIGDLVLIDGEYGRVEAITLRSVRIVTPDARMVSIPNRAAASGKATSYTNEPHLRLDIEITVGVEEDLGRAREILLGVVRADEAFMITPEPVVVVTRLGDYFVGLELRAWLSDERRHLRARTRLREAAFEALRAAKVEMPFETLALVGPAAAAQAS